MELYDSVRDRRANQTCVFLYADDFKLNGARETLKKRFDFILLVLGTRNDCFQKKNLEN